MISEDNYPWKPLEDSANIVSEWKLPASVFEIEVRRAKTSNRLTYRLLVGKKKRVAGVPLRTIKRELKAAISSPKDNRQKFRKQKQKTRRTGSGRKTRY